MTHQWKLGGWVYTSARRNIISCQKFWQGAKVLAQNFGKEKMCQKFWHRISCQNSVPKFWAKILAPCQNFRHEILAWNILAWNFGTKNLPKFLAEIFGSKGYFGTQMNRPPFPYLWPCVLLVSCKYLNLSSNDRILKIDPCKKVGFSMLCMLLDR